MMQGGVRRVRADLFLDVLRNVLITISMACGELKCLGARERPTFSMWYLSIASIAKKLALPYSVIA